MFAFVVSTYTCDLSWFRCLRLFDSMLALIVSTIQVLSLRTYDVVLHCKRLPLVLLFIYGQFELCWPRMAVQLQ